VSVILRVDVFAVDLPFRFSFGHALAARRSTRNLVVRVALGDGSVGYGEGVPREYVTGETIEGAITAVADRLAPELLEREVATAGDVSALLETLPSGDEGEGTGTAARCALELAVLDAAGRSLGLSVGHWLGPQERQVRYDAVLPFSSPRKLAALAVAIRSLGIRQVKVKVGVDSEREAQALRLLRRVLGRDADLRVDANCAWTREAALEALTRFRPFRISAVEQPLPANDLDGLASVSATVPEAVIVDESLRTVAEAEQLVERRACDAFNIRVSKCGGLLPSLRIAQIAADAGLGVVVGAQVGESGLLSAAGRHLAAAVRPRYLEGSGGSLLLKEDLTVGRVLPGRGGRARVFAGPGLGVQVDDATLQRRGTLARTVSAGAGVA
jgi:L-Ala-D/L-Glu epimerase